MIVTFTKLYSILINRGTVQCRQVRLGGGEKSNCSTYKACIFHFFCLRVVFSTAEGTFVIISLTRKQRGLTLSRWVSIMFTCSNSFICDSIFIYLSWTFSSQFAIFAGELIKGVKRRLIHLCCHVLDFIRKSKTSNQQSYIHKLRNLLAR